MKIGVVADTHSREVPQPMLDDFKNVDLIIHAGDFCSPRDLELLCRIKEVKGVYGNMDGPEIRKIFPRKQILRCGKFSVGLFHGEGPPGTILDKVRGEFAKDSVDCVVFGHSHVAFNQKIGDILFFNPGSPNDTVCAPFCSYGILNVGDSKIVGKIVKIK